MFRFESLHSYHNMYISKYSKYVLVPICCRCCSWTVNELLAYTDQQQCLYLGYLRTQCTLNKFENDFAHYDVDKNKYLLYSHLGCAIIATINGRAIWRAKKKKKKPAACIDGSTGWFFGWIFVSAVISIRLFVKKTKKKNNKLQKSLVVLILSP